MSIFARPKYESDFTQFLSAWKQRDPALQQAQQTGLALLWDKAPLDKDARERAAAGAVKRQSYVYE